MVILKLKICRTKSVLETLFLFWYLFLNSNMSSHLISLNSGNTGPGWKHGCSHFYVAKAGLTPPVFLLCLPSPGITWVHHHARLWCLIFIMYMTYISHILRVWILDCWQNGVGGVRPNKTLYAKPPEHLYTWLSNEHLLDCQRLLPHGTQKHPLPLCQPPPSFLCGLYVPS